MTLLGALPIGCGTFGDGIGMPVLNPAVIATAELNRDGVADFVSAEDGLAIYLGPCP